MKKFRIKGPFSMTFHLDVDETVEAETEEEAIGAVVSELSAGNAHSSNCQWEGDAPVISQEGGSYTFVITVEVDAGSLKSGYRKLYDTMGKIDQEDFQWSSTDEAYTPDVEGVIDPDDFQKVRMEVFAELDAESPEPKDLPSPNEFLFHVFLKKEAGSLRDAYQELYPHLVDMINSGFDSGLVSAQNKGETIPVNELEEVKADVFEELDFVGSPRAHEFWRMWRTRGKDKKPLKPKVTQEEFPDCWGEYESAHRTCKACKKKLSCRMETDDKEQT